MTGGPRLQALPVIPDAERGKLGVAEAGTHVPFQPARAFYLYDLPAGAVRGEHAHREDQQFLICLSGVFEVVAEYRGLRQTFELSGPEQGLYAPAMTWLELRVRIADSLLLVLAARAYDEADYIRDYDAFRRAALAESP